MSKKNLKVFEESLSGITGYTILLDVDGTLLPDGDSELSPEVRTAVRTLKEENSIYLVTNGKDANRAQQIADVLEVPIAPVGAPAGKPRLKAAKGIPTDRPLLVIGDMLTTDGFLAHRLHARFVRVQTKHSAKRRPYLYFSHFVDDVVSFFV